MKSQESQKKVFVALSGGVDSAVAAALLKERGYDVAGVFIKIWQPEFSECTWREDRLDAMRVAAALEIPFEEVDFSEKYKREVIDDMLAAYKKGITPNPDVMCNRHIKFGALWEWAKERGADYIATGHHARVKRISDKTPPFGSLAPKWGEWGLLRGVDAEKDQSYFLWQLTQYDLEHTLMPVGELQKSEVRSLARKYALPVADKPDSQGLCFVGDIAMSDFLERYIAVEKGDVYDTRGNIIGVHNGALLYTIGQREGLNIHSGGSARAPYYVVAVDVAANRVVASTHRMDAAVKNVCLYNENWINSLHQYDDLSCMVRYRQIPQSCRLEKSAITGTRVHFSEPLIASTGQSLVLYNVDSCLGGGMMRAK